MWGIIISAMAIKRDRERGGRPASKEEQDLQNIVLVLIGAMLLFALVVIAIVIPTH